MPWKCSLPSTAFVLVFMYPQTLSTRLSPVGNLTPQIHYWDQISQESFNRHPTMFCPGRTGYLFPPVTCTCMVPTALHPRGDLFYCTYQHDFITDIDVHVVAPEFCIGKNISPYPSSNDASDFWWRGGWGGGGGDRTCLCLSLATPCLCHTYAISMDACIVSFFLVL